MFVSQKDLAHGAVMEIAGVEVTFERSIENLRRVEAAAGAAAPFAQRLDARAATHTEIVRVYSALLRGVHDAPAARDVEAWAFRTGSRHPALAQFIFSLTLSSDELDAVIAARNLAAGKPAEDGASHPFAPTAAPTGPSSSASATGSASLRERLMQRASSN